MGGGHINDLEGGRERERLRWARSCFPRESNRHSCSSHFMIVCSSLVDGLKVE